MPWNLGVTKGLTVFGKRAAEQKCLCGAGVIHSLPTVTSCNNSLCIKRLRQFLYAVWAVLWTTFGAAMLASEAID